VRTGANAAGVAQLRSCARQSGARTNGRLQAGRTAIPGLATRARRAISLGSRCGRRNAVGLNQAPIAETPVRIGPTDGRFGDGPGSLAVARRAASGAPVAPVPGTVPFEFRCSPLRSELLRARFITGPEDLRENPA
jgi:hypothetical protein